MRGDIAPDAAKEGAFLHGADQRRREVVEAPIETAPLVHDRRGDGKTGSDWSGVSCEGARGKAVQKKPSLRHSGDTSGTFAAPYLHQPLKRTVKKATISRRAEKAVREGTLGSGLALPVFHEPAALIDRVEIKHIFTVDTMYTDLCT